MNASRLYGSVEAHLSLLIKTQDIVAHAARPAALHFVLVPKELLASEASAVVQLAVGQNPQQSALPSIHIPNNRHSADEMKEKSERVRKREKERKREREKGVSLDNYM